MSIEVKLAPELQPIVERARSLARERGELLDAPSIKPWTDLSDEARIALAEWISSGDYNNASLQLERRGSPLNGHKPSQQGLQRNEPVPLPGWGDVFADTTIAAAMLDRLLYRSVVVNITGDSYRMRAHRARARKLTTKGGAA